MANLRANKIYGTSGPDANGSALFNGTDYLTASNAAAFRLNQGSGADLTIEAWIYAKSVGTQFTIASLYHTTGNKRSYNLYVNSDAELKFNYSGSGTAGSTSVLNAGLFPTNTWVHVAVTHDTSATTLRLFKNGLLKDDDTSAHATWYANTDGDFVVGSSLDGFISNLHINKGTCKYTAAFDPYKQPIEVETNTSVLCCNSSTDALNDDKSNSFVQTASGGVKPTSDTPFNRSDAGVVFDGDIKINSKNYIYFPTGDTSQRGRGRGIICGGYTGPSPTYNQTIEYITIQSHGIAKDFGDLSSTAKGAGSTLGNEIRAVAGGGHGSPVNLNSMEYFEIATQSNTTDFGDLTNNTRNLTSLANSTRGIFAGGTYAPGSPGIMFDTIQYIAIATLGDATDFGNMVDGRRDSAALSSPTRGIIAGGNPGSGPQVTDEIDYITIATAGNAADFGNMTNSEREIGGAASSTRGIIFGGYSSPAFRNTIDYITIATTGNASDFGDLTVARTGPDGCSNRTRAAMCGGSSPTYVNLIDFVTLATTGNAADFGDMVGGRIMNSGCTSDSHGGLS